MRPDTCKPTTSTLALPVSRTVNGKDSDNPVVVSFSTRKAWCGRLPSLLSVAVRVILRVSVVPSVKGLETAEAGEKLVNVSNPAQCQTSFACITIPLLSCFSTGCSSFALYGDLCIAKRPLCLRYRQARSDTCGSDQLHSACGGGCKQFAGLRLRSLKVQLSTRSYY